MGDACAGELESPIFSGEEGLARPVFRGEPVRLDPMAEGDMVRRETVGEAEPNMSRSSSGFDLVGALDAVGAELRLPSPAPNRLPPTGTGGGCENKSTGSDSAHIGSDWGTVAEMGDARDAEDSGISNSSSNPEAA